jgi:hypothetical protein
MFCQLASWFTAVCKSVDSEVIKGTEGGNKRQSIKNVDYKRLFLSAASLSALLQQSVSKNSKRSRDLCPCGTQL